MGSTISSDNKKKEKSLNVITLNYSGILLSPFQFFSKEKGNKDLNQIEQNLSNIFKSILKRESKDQFSPHKNQNKFKWNLGKIDQKMQKQRYSPLYDSSAGCIGQKLISISKFQAEWDKKFDEQSKNIKGLQYTPENIQQALWFDTICYKTILTHVYPAQLKAVTELENYKIQNLKVEPYIKFMKMMFDKCFLNEQKKMQKTFQAMQKQQLDIVFVQQANERLIQQLKKKHEYVLFHTQKGQSLIICKTQKFTTLHSTNFTNKRSCPLDQNSDLKAKLNWNNDTAIAFVDDLILVSGHLSSKKQKNPTQMYQMIQTLKSLAKAYPMTTIIVGCDANAFIYESLKAYDNNLNVEQAIPKGWSIFPSTPNMFTTSKQRTYLQPQINKAEEPARVCRDYLILIDNKHVDNKPVDSKLEGDKNVNNKSQKLLLKQQKVCTIFGKSTDDIPNLPCQQHPYDHYVVKATIVINV